MHIRKTNKRISGSVALGAAPHASSKVPRRSQTGTCAIARSLAFVALFWTLLTPVAMHASASASHGCSSILQDSIYAKFYAGQQGQHFHAFKQAMCTSTAATALWSQLSGSREIRAAASSLSNAMDTAAGVLLPHSSGRRRGTQMKQAEDALKKALCSPESVSFDGYDRLAFALHARICMSFSTPWPVTIVCIKIPDK